MKRLGWAVGGVLGFIEGAAVGGVEGARLGLHKPQARGQYSLRPTCFHFLSQRPNGFAATHSQVLSRSCLNRKVGSSTQRVGVATGAAVVGTGARGAERRRKERLMIFIIVGRKEKDWRMSEMCFCDLIPQKP